MRNWASMENISNWLQTIRYPCWDSCLRRNNMASLYFRTTCTTCLFLNKRQGRTIFILVRTCVNGKEQFFLRRIKHVYTAGQIQPKLEVFCPYSRAFRLFLKKLLKYYINNSFSSGQVLKIPELKKLFPTINDNNLRRTIKKLGGQQSFNNTKEFVFNERILEANKADDYAGEMEVSLTPEELCLYERMYQSFYDVLNFGIRSLKSSDKISLIKSKFCTKNINDSFKCMLARRIVEELNLTSWNISQSYLLAIQTQGRMYLTGKSMF